MSQNDSKNESEPLEQRVADVKDLVNDVSLALTDRLSKLEGSLETALRQHARFETILNQISRIEGVQAGSTRVAFFAGLLITAVIGAALTYLNRQIDRSQSELDKQVDKQIENTKATDKRAEELELKIADFETKLNRAHADYEEKLNRSNEQLNQAHKHLADAKRAIDAHDHVDVRHEVENVLNGLRAVDLLHSKKYEVTKNYLAEKQKKLRNLSDADSGYCRFIDALVMFSNLQPERVGKSALDKMLQNMADVRESERTANYYYFLASLQARRGCLCSETQGEEKEDWLDRAGFSLDEAEAHSGGLTTNVNARIRNGRVTLKLLKTQEAEPLSDDSYKVVKEELDKLLQESPFFWPARLNYSIALLKHGEKGLDQLIEAVNQGGATIDDIVEMISLDLQFPGDNAISKLKNEVLPPEKGTWADALAARLRDELEKARKQDRSAQ